MKTSAKYRTPDDMEVDITFTAPIGQIRKMRELINQSPGAYQFPLGDLMEELRKAVNWADRSYYNDTEETDD